MVISLSLSTAGNDYTPGPYTVSFTSGQLYATLMVSTMDDNFTELSEDFMVAITSTDQPSVVEIVSPNTAFITIEDNDPGTVHSVHEMCWVSYVRMHAYMYVCNICSCYVHMHIQCICICDSN